MRGVIEHDPLVDLVGQRDDIPALTKLGQDRQLAPTENFAGRVMGCVEQEQARARPKGVGRFLRIE